METGERGEGAERGVRGRGPRRRGQSRARKRSVAFLHFIGRRKFGGNGEDGGERERTGV